MLETLLACAGHWQGANTLQDPMSGQPDRSPATASITPMLGGTFVRFDYTWRYQGNPQEGSILFGYTVDEQVITAYWIDSWHMADKGMICRGDVTTDSGISVFGTYDAGEGPEWGWRIVVMPTEKEKVRVIMYNIDPEGQAELAVEAVYTRTPSMYR